jgi:SAM-dependent methyltransferase
MTTDPARRLRALRWNWQRFGETDPFWAVLTDPGHAGRGWEAPEAKARFFETGRADVSRILDQVRAAGLRVSFERALDFGCGVGRLTQALAEHFRQVVGLDIAPAMLERARQENRYGSRVRYVVTDRGDLAVLGAERFDLILSLLVLQHMAPADGLATISQFVRRLTPGGAAVFNLPHASAPLPSAWRRWWARLRGRPRMEMHGAPIGAVGHAVEAVEGVVAARTDVNWGAPGSLYVIAPAPLSRREPSA